MTVSYDANLGIVTTAFRVHATVIPLVLARAEFYILLCVNLGITYAVRSGYFDPVAYHAELGLPAIAVTGSLMTFFIVFYNGNVFSRYNKIYDLTKDMLESVLMVASLLDKDIENRHLVRRLARWLIAHMLVFFYERSGTMSDDAWQKLLGFGVIQKHEKEYFQRHARKLGHHAIPTYTFIHWSLKLYRASSPRIPELEKAYFNIRKCEENITELLELPMPFQFFHIMNFMMLLNLCLMAYALALADSDFGPVIFFFAQLMFQGIRELSVALSDPFGDDVTDFPMSDWMTATYKKIYELIEMPFLVDKDVEQLSMPMPQIWLDEMTIFEILAGPCETKETKRTKK